MDSFIHCKIFIIFIPRDIYFFILMLFNLRAHVSVAKCWGIRCLSYYSYNLILK